VIGGAVAVVALLVVVAFWLRGRSEQDGPREDPKAAWSPEKKAAYAELQAEIARINDEEMKQAERTVAEAQRQADDIMLLAPFARQQETARGFLTTAEVTLYGRVTASQARRETARLNFAKRWGDLPREPSSLSELARINPEKSRALEELRSELRRLYSEESSDTINLRRDAYGQPTDLNGLPLNSRSRNYDQALAFFKQRQAQAEFELAKIGLKYQTKRQAARLRFINQWGEIPSEFDAPKPSP
jgi:hypothetical protein